MSSNLTRLVRLTCAATVCAFGGSPKTAFDPEKEKDQHDMCRSNLFALKAQLREQLRQEKRSRAASKHNAIARMANLEPVPDLEDHDVRDLPEAIKRLFGKYFMYNWMDWHSKFLEPNGYIKIPSGSFVGSAAHGIDEFGRRFVAFKLTPEPGEDGECIYPEYAGTLFQRYNRDTQLLSTNMWVFGGDTERCLLDKIGTNVAISRSGELAPNFMTTMAEYIDVDEDEDEDEDED